MENEFYFVMCTREQFSVSQGTKQVQKTRNWISNHLITNKQHVGYD